MKQRALAVAVVLVVSLSMLATPPAGALIDADGWDRRAIPDSSDAQVIVGNFGGDESADVLWYRPGPPPDAIWYGRAGARGQSNMVKRSVSITGRYQPIVGDFAGADGYDEILWYAPGTTQDYLWRSIPGDYSFGRQGQPLSVNGNFTWAVLEDNRGGKDDIAWIAKGDARDNIWHFNDNGNGWPGNTTVSAEGPYELVAGDYDGNGYDDLFLHAPGSNREELWRSSPQGTVSRTILKIDRPFDLITIRQSGGDDLFLRPRGEDPDVIPWDQAWQHGNPPFGQKTIVHPYSEGRPSHAISFGNGRVLLYDADTPEYFLRYTNSGELEVIDVDQDEQTPSAGDFDADGNLDILWVNPDGTAGSFWYAPAP